jgi:hypothetical protein
MVLEFDEDAEYQEFLQLATAIGFVVINWSQIERQIDNWVMVAFNRCGGKTLSKKGRIPKMFTDKKEFLIRCFQKLPLLAPFKDEGLHLLNDALKISLKRNNFIHGTLNNLTATKGVFNFQRLVHGEKFHQVESFSYALSDWPALEQSILSLLRDSRVLSEKLAEAFFKT